MVDEEQKNEDASLGNAGEDTLEAVSDDSTSSDTANGDDRIATSRSRARARPPSKRTISREDRRRRSEAKKSRKRRFYMAGGGAIALALIAGLVLPSVGGGGVAREPAANPVEAAVSVGTPVEIQTGDLVDDGTEITYSTYPPTSGPRLAQGAEWGLHATQLPDEAIVRNLEQGAVIFNHNLTDAADLETLNSYVEGLPGYPGCYVVHAYAQVPQGSVTLTSWGWTETVKPSNRDAMESFVAQHRNKGPSFLDSTCGTGGELAARNAESQGDAAS